MTYTEPKLELVFLERNDIVTDSSPILEILRLAPSMTSSEESAGGSFSSALPQTRECPPFWESAGIFLPFFRDPDCQSPAETV